MVATRPGRFTAADRTVAAAAFRVDWRAYRVVNATQEPVDLAAELVVSHELRGFAAIHVAFAVWLREQTRQS
jgi:hypothetical protein